VPGGMMALGVPAKLREGSPRQASMIGEAGRSYVARGPRYREELRRID